MKTTMRTILFGALLVAGCGSSDGQPEDGSATSCEVVDGAPVARVTAGPDGWCDFDGLACACHGHGAGDSCAAATAAFDACIGADK